MYILPFTDGLQKFMCYGYDKLEIYFIIWANFKDIIGKNGCILGSSRS